MSAFTGSGRVIAAIGLLLLPACGFQNVAFRQDTRLDFQMPGDRDIVSLPVTIDWDFDDDTADGITFGVFIDRRPMSPGATLTSISDDDDICQRDPGCPDADYFAERGVHTTTDTAFTVDALRRPNSDDTRREIHEVTVIIIDADGRRVGESAWSLEFEIDRAVPVGAGA